MFGSCGENTLRPHGFTHAGEVVPFSARSADGLSLVAESFLAHGASESDGGDRFQIVVHVAEETAPCAYLMDIDARRKAFQLERSR